MALELTITELLLTGLNKWKLLCIKKSDKELILKKIKASKLKLLLDFLTWKTKALLILQDLKKLYKN